MKSNLLFYIGIFLFILTWLFSGIKLDSEFYEPSVFLKPRPSFKVYFYSQIGESDLVLSDLTGNKNQEEKSFIEFVKNSSSSNSITKELSFLPFLLLQFSLSFLFIGFIHRKRIPKIRFLVISVHFLISLIISTTCILFALAFYELFITLLFITLILVLNYVFVRILIL